MFRRLALLPVLAAAGLALAGCGGSQPAAPPVTITVSAPAPVPTSIASAPAQRVALPEVSGRNGQIVYDELTRLGLTNLQLASRDEEDKVVLNPANWTAVKIEPGAGTEVGTSDTVVVTMTKKG